MERRQQLCGDEDARLMYRVAAGNVEAFNRLYRKFYPIVRRSFADCAHSHISPDDLTQEVFARLWQYRRNFRGDSLFLTYLLTIARHIRTEKTGRYRRITRLDLREHEDFIVDSPNDLSQPEAELCFKELNATLYRIRATLTAGQQEALEIALAADIPFCEASQKLGCSCEALKNRLKRARKRLRQRMAHVLKED